MTTNTTTNTNTDYANACLTAGRSHIGDDDVAGELWLGSVPVELLERRARLLRLDNTRKNGRRARLLAEWVAERWPSDARNGQRLLAEAVLDTDTDSGIDLPALVASAIDVLGAELAGWLADGLSVPACADRLGVSPQTVRRRLAAARELLARE